MQMKQLDTTAGSCIGWQSFARLFNNASQAVTAEAVASKRVPSPQKREDTRLFSSFCFDGIYRCLHAVNEMQGKGCKTSVIARAVMVLYACCPWKGPLFPDFFIAALIY